MKDRKANSVRKDKKISRRHFLGSAATVAAFTIVPSHVLGGNGKTAPSEKINIAIIGTGGQGIVNMKQLLNEPDAHIVALCDIKEISDYSMFYYGGTAGLKPALELVRQQYSQPCPTHRDYNEMLDKNSTVILVDGVTEADAIYHSYTGGDDLMLALLELYEANQPTTGNVHL